MFSNAADLPKSTNAQERKRNIETASQQNSDLNNPCMKEQKLSLKCLSDNNYDKDSCAVVFANYKACREFWSKVQTDRRARGITPSLPRPEDREVIKAEYLAKRHSKPRR